MKRVMFVDDEPQLLYGLRDAMRKQRHRWDMVFCAGGAEALQRMATSQFDLLVTDLRMPGMDGADLLKQVKQLYPSTIRIVLSGQADRDLVIKLLPVSQQFLGKPCNTDRLRSVIDRALELRGLLDDPVLLSLVGEMGALPSVPSTYWQLTEALASGTAGMGVISEMVERDAGLTARLLQIVNSAYFGLAQPVASVPAAANFLGIEMLKALALMVGIFTVAEESATVDGFSLERAQREALLVAQVARRIVPDRTRRDEAFTAGVLHDVGKLILATRLPRRYGAVLREAADGKGPLHALELELIGATHASVGAVLLGSWGLPIEIVQAVAFHHAMRAGSGGDDLVTLAVHVADVLITSLMAGTPPAANLDLQTIEQLGYLDSLAEWEAIANEVVKSAA